MPGYEFGNYRRPVAGHPSVDLLPIAICRYHGEGYGEMVTLIVGGEVGTDGMMDRPRSAQSFGRRFHRIYTPSDQFER